MLRLLLVAVSLILAGCGEDDSCCDLPSASNARWFAGDFHVHTSVGSNDTRYPDGTARSFPETVRDVAVERGMSFVVITDHSNSAGSKVDTLVECEDQWNRGPEFPLWETAAELSTGDFLMIDGSEISPVSTLDPDLCPDCSTVGTGQLTPVGHIGCAPLDLETFDLAGAFIDRPPGAVTGSQSVAECKLRGGFAIINHPFYRSTAWIDYDWTSYDYDAIEVFNGSVGYSAFDVAAYDAYLCDRLAGRDVVAVGGSDNHRTPLPYEDPVSTQNGPPLGLPVTSIRAERLDWPAIVDGLSTGHIVIHEIGTFVELEIRDAGGQVLGGVGDTIVDPPASVSFRLRGRSRRTQEVRIYFAGLDSCTERRQAGRDIPPIVARQVLFRQSVCSGTACDFEIDVDVNAAPGLYFGTAGNFEEPSINGRDVAVTNAVMIERS
jgi:hypothetical protein